MDLLNLLKAAIMGIVEGLTEFLPVSSTGHLIIAEAVLGFRNAVGGEGAAQTFEIFIQLGAILAVVAYFARDLLSLIARAAKDSVARRVLLNVLIAFVPAAVVGLLFSSTIKAYLFNPRTVAVALIIGGIAMLLVEARHIASRTETIEKMGPMQALGVGLAQIIALIPGMSRSAWTLIGGMFSGLDRSTALRFSFYLSIPTLGAATIYDLYKSRDLLSADAIPAFAVGLIVSFVVALVVVKFFLGWVARHDLKPFAWYRIAAGIALLALTATGILTV